jgi:hypothetical protein
VLRDQTEARALRSGAHALKRAERAAAAKFETLRVSPGPFVEITLVLSVTAQNQRDISGECRQSASGSVARSQAAQLQVLLFK